MVALRKTKTERADRQVSGGRGASALSALVSTNATLTSDASVLILFSMSQDLEENGQLHTLGLLEQLRGECERLWGSSSEFYFRVDKLLREIANPNLHDIPTQLPFRVEMWNPHDQHVRWVIAASASVAVGHAALDAAIAAYPGERFTLQNGILVIREHQPK